MPFPNEEIVLKATFKDFIAFVDKVDKDSITEEKDELAMRFLMCLTFLARPRELRFYRNRYGFIVKYYARWNYVGTREAEEYNEEELEKAQMRLAEAVDKNYTIIEFREMNEGDSIFVAVHPDDVEVIKEILRMYDFIL